MILHGIIDNIIIPNPSYSSMYQDKGKKRAVTRDKYIFGSKPNQKKLTRGWRMFLRQHWKQKIISAQHAFK